MERRVHLYVSSKNMLVWLMALCMVSSAVARIVIFGMKGTESGGIVLCQILLPIAATLLYAAITMLDGKNGFYKTAIPVWLISAHSLFWISRNIPGKLLVGLFWIAVIFFASAYAELVSGKRRYAIWLLLPVVLSPVAFLTVLYKEALISAQADLLLPLLPTVLACVGVAFTVLAVRVNTDGAYHATWGDRADGRRLRTLPAMAQVSPYIMDTRNTSSNAFSESFEISNIDRYIRQKRKEGLTSFGIMHVFLAAYCRSVAKYPGLNRFISGQKVYSRGNDIQFCLTVKKEMTVSSPDTVIKVHLTPNDTAEDVYHKINQEIENVKNAPLNSDFDNTAGILMLIPGVLLKFVVWVLKVLDYFGLLPKFLLEVSPFHGSVFFTSMGSLGIPPIYHHLYDFGNLPVFVAFGLKRRAVEVQEDGSIVTRKYVDCKFTLDERIVDGYYYATFFKYFRRLLRKPELLDAPPAEVAEDIP